MKFKKIITLLFSLISIVAINSASALTIMTSKHWNGFKSYHMDLSKGRAQLVIEPTEFENSCRGQTIFSIYRDEQDEINKSFTIKFTSKGAIKNAWMFEPSEIKLSKTDNAGMVSVKVNVCFQNAQVEVIKSK